MTPEQLDTLITHYKQKAVHAYHANDTFACNRMIAIVHELENNYDDYLEHESAADLMFILVIINYCCSFSIGSIELNSQK